MELAKEKREFRDFDTYGWNSAIPEGSKIPVVVNGKPYSEQSESLKSRG